MTAVRSEPGSGLELKPLAKLVGCGPTAELVDLARWAAWRWAGRTVQFLRTASPRRVVNAVNRSAADAAPPSPDSGATDFPWFEEALRGSGGVLRIPPAGDRWPLVQAAVSLGNPLLVTPGRFTAEALARRLRDEGHTVALMPDDWSLAAGGAIVVGTRAAAFAPVHRCGAMVVLDEHDEGLVEERTPTWNARDVLVERASRLRIPCILVSPHPSLEAQQTHGVRAAPRPVERAGWPRLHIIDRREDAPTAGVFSPGLAKLMSQAERIACVLNRKGRSRLLGCAGCGELAHCESCGSALGQVADGELECRHCGEVRPVVCPACGSTRFKNLRMGVDRVREELEALLRRPVAEVTAGGWSHGEPGAPVVVGTEAVLHQVRRADLVAFLEFDQDLLAPRFRAGEQALALLSKAARLVGPRARGGVVAVQTRVPDNSVLVAVAAGRPADLDEPRRLVRAQLRMPPTTAIAAVAGEAAEEFVESLRGTPGLEVSGGADGQWILRAVDHEALCGALSEVPRPAGRLRLSVDPQRV